MHHTPLTKALLTAALLPLAAVLVSPVQAQAQTSPRERVSLDADWRFIKGDPAEAGAQFGYATIKDTLLANASGAELVVKADPKSTLGTNISYTQPSFNDASWRHLNLPQDWGIEGPFSQELQGVTGRLPWAAVGWYRKTFKLPAGFDGKQVFLDIDGAMSYSNIWVNGHYAGGWPYGYTSFQVDVTPYVKADGDNVIAIRLDNPPASSRWYPGGGIYRNVWLEAADPVHIAHWGTYVTTPEITKDSATVNEQVTVDNQSTATVNDLVKTEIYALNTDGRITGPPVAAPDLVGIKIDAGSSQVVSLTLKISQPKLWGLQQRNLYAAVTTVYYVDHGDLVGNKAIDTTQTNFGIRTFKFDPAVGFLLNGEHIKINGVCDHGDLGPLGIAINVRGLERQIEILQEMGCNAIRTSHNPPSPEFLDLCDRMGMLVIDEAFDTWERVKNSNDYNILFADWHKKDVQSLVRRDRNHPSVMLWSMGNEIDQQGTPRGNEVFAELAGIARAEDPTRPATSANNRSGFSSVPVGEFVFGFNYEFNRTTKYDIYHASNPDVPMVATESASTISSTGFYTFPLSNIKSSGIDQAAVQVNSYDLTAPPWANAPDIDFARQDRLPYVAGEFVWTGFDYLGEPTPFGLDNDKARSSYFGIVDLMGFKKDRFYLYQARWRPDLPMAHIVPQNWNWPDMAGKVIPVHIYTSGDEAELFLNGKSLGRKKKVSFETGDPTAESMYRIRFDDVLYQPGELKVVTYKDGQKWSEDTVKTTGPAAKVALTPDHATIKADGQDLSYVTVTIKDKDDLKVPTASNHVVFDISGPGEILAVGNSDPTSFEPFQGKTMRAFYGQCLVIVRSQSGQPGAITLTAKSDGLAAASVNITSSN